VFEHYLVLQLGSGGESVNIDAAVVEQARLRTAAT
jgi:hypothetical protein